jgi:hypothetical protein
MARFFQNFFPIKKKQINVTTNIIEFKIINFVLSFQNNTQIQNKYLPSLLIFIVFFSFAARRFVCVSLQLIGTNLNY